jgi:hypothetical protein
VVHRGGIIDGSKGNADIQIHGFNESPTSNNADGEQSSTISDDLEPYTGPIGVGSPFYGLKIAMENLDETFTFNETERMEKRISHADLRITEVKRNS